MWLFILGLFVGATLGAFGMAIIAAGKRGDYFSSSSARLRSDRYSGGLQFSSRKNVHDRHLMDHGGFTSGNYYGKD